MDVALLTLGAIAGVVLLIRWAAGNGSEEQRSERRGRLEVDIIDYGRVLAPGERGLSQR